MAQNQATGGNSMAATLGNLQNKTQRPGAPPTANYGAGMQAPMMGRGPMQMGGAIPLGGAAGQNPNMMGGALGPAAQQPMQGQVWRGPPPGQQGMQPIPPGGAGYPQMSPDAMQNMMGQISQLQQRPGGFNAPGQMPRRPMGAPGMGAGGGKNQQIAQLRGGPPMGR